MRVARCVRRAKRLTLHKIMSKEPAMQISTRFTIGVHTLLCIAYFDGKARTTSKFIAGSVNANPVVIRRALVQLKDAGLIEVAAGTGGASLAKPVSDITLLDVFDAVESVEDGGLFDFHANPNPACPVGGSMHKLLDNRLREAEEALRANLAQTTLQDLLDELPAAGE